MTIEPWLVSIASSTLGLGYVALTSWRHAVAERRRAGIGELVRLIHTSARREELSELLSSYLPSVSGCPRGGVFLLAPSRNILDAVCHWGPQDAAPFGPEDCFAARVGKTWRSGPSASRPCPHLRGGSGICVPLVAGADMLGVLTIKDCCSKASAERLAGQLSLALASFRLRTQLHDSSIRDSLTGLLNRRFADEELAKVCARAIRAGQPVSMVMADVDHFKIVNDRQGHAAGDEALRAIARVLGGGVRQEDTAARWGGEEFVLIMPSATISMAAARAEELRAEIAELDVAHDGRPLGKLSASFGVASFPEHGADPKALQKAAFAAMYAAKKAGRNQVVVAPDPTQH